MSITPEEREFKAGLFTLRSLSQWLLALGAIWGGLGVCAGFVLAATASPGGSSAHPMLWEGIALVAFALASGLTMIVIARIAEVVAQSATWSGKKAESPTLETDSRT